MRSFPLRSGLDFESFFVKVPDLQAVSEVIRLYCTNPAVQHGTWGMGKPTA